MKLNCWEYKKCGREEGGERVHELGVCNASINPLYTGRNHGDMSGRFCWHVEGTLCEGKVQGNFNQKMLQCAHCDFFKHVKKDEGEVFEY